MFAKHAYWETGTGGSNPPLSAFAGRSSLQKSEGQLRKSDKFLNRLFGMPATADAIRRIDRSSLQKSEGQLRKSDKFLNRLFGMPATADAIRIELKIFKVNHK